MTYDPKEQSYEEARDAEFGRWWFLNGGMLHPWWKRRQYSKIHEAAMCLPKVAAEHMSNWATARAKDEIECERRAKVQQTIFYEQMKVSAENLEAQLTAERRKTERFRTALEVYAMTNATFPEYGDVAREALSHEEEK